MKLLNYNELKSRADAYSNRVNRRALALVRRAGCECYIQMHNALVDRDLGRGWPGVDYKLLRRARWTYNQQYRASEVLNRLYDRKGFYGFDWS